MITMVEDDKLRNSPANYREAKKILSADPLPVKGVRDLKRQIPLFYKYDQRAMTQARNGEHGDIVLVTGEYDASWVDHLRDMGFGPGSRNVIRFPPSPQLIPLMKRFNQSKRFLARAVYEIVERHDGSSPLAVDVYVSTTEAQRFAQSLEETLGVEVGYNGVTTDISDRFNNKARLYELIDERCEEARVGPHTIVDMREKDWTQKLREAWETHNIDGVAAVKGEYGASGSALWKLREDNLDDILRAVRKNRESERFIVEPMYNIENSLSILGYIDQEGVHLNEYISGQVLLEKEWNGNFFPRKVDAEDKEQIVNAAQEIGEIKREEGYLGRFGLDFMKPANQGLEVTGLQLVAEDNARMTGSSAYANIQHELEDRHGEEATVVSYKIKLDQVQNYDELLYVIGEDVFYDGNKLEGVIPGHFITGGEVRPEEAEVMFGAVAPRGDRETLKHLIDKTALELGAEKVAEATKQSIS